MLLQRLLHRNAASLSSLTRSESFLLRSFTCASWLRQSAIHTEGDSIDQLPDLDPSKLSITKSITPKKLVPPEELLFGRTFTGSSRAPISFSPHAVSLTESSHIIPDHMLSIEWTASHGWLAPRITPYQNLSLDPATCVFHYAFECFEGMKAYRCPSDSSLRLFRPNKNMERFNKSAARIALPTFDGEALISLIGKFCALDSRFIPATPDTPSTCAPRSSAPSEHSASGRLAPHCCT